MDNEDLSAVLKEWGFEQYAEEFERNGFDLESLCLLELEQLKEIIVPLGHRLKFWKALCKFKKDHQPEESAEHQSQDAKDTPDETNKRPVSPELLAPTPKRFQKWKGSDAIRNLKIEDLLTTKKGKPIAVYYNKHQVLNDQCRRRLVRVVGEAVVELQPCPTPEDFLCVEEKILNIFKSEQKEVYFIKSKTEGKDQRNHKGKLANWIRNFKTRSNNLEKSSGVQIESESEDDEDIPEAIENSEDILNADGWLKDNLQPWLEVKNKWALTFDLRQRRLLQGSTAELVGSYLEEYKALRQVLGYTLLVQDFEKRFPPGDHSLESEWLLKRRAFLRLLEVERYDNLDVQELIKNFDSLPSEDAKDNAVLFSLLDLFPCQPRRKGVKVVKGKKLLKPTQAESRDAFILHVTVANDVETAIERRVGEMRKGDRLQPFVLAVGREIGSLSNFYCCIDDVKYAFKSLREALDVTFKATFALNAGYSVEALSAWLFLQRAFYKIQTSKDPKDSAVTASVGSFRALMEIERKKDSLT